VVIHYHGVEASRAIAAHTARLQIQGDYSCAAYVVAALQRHRRRAHPIRASGSSDTQPSQQDQNCQSARSKQLQ
jgi:hypothetical protein